MRNVVCLVSFLCLVVTPYLSSQNIPIAHFASGDKVLSDNIDDFVANPDVSSVEVNDGFYNRYIQFDNIPGLSEQRQLEASGLKIIEYLPDNVYLMAIPETYDVGQLLGRGIRSVVKTDIEDKLDQLLIDGSRPDWALGAGGHIKVMIKAYPYVSRKTFLNGLSSAGVVFNKSDVHYPYVFTEILDVEALSLADLTFVQYIELGPNPGEPEDTGGRTLQRANLINNLLPGGLRYDGSGVNVLVRDDGVVGPHIDFEGRMFDFTGGSNTGTHGDGVAGVMAGAGNLDPTTAGAASGSGVYVTNYQSTFTDNTIDLHQNNGVMVTNSSYSNGCNAGYTTTTQRVDQQMIDNPSLMHVFSAGNSNNQNCGYGAGNQWGNVTGGHKVGKNVMATANLTATGGLVGSSSRGPAHDGRIKPDISAHGAGEISTSTNNTYQSFGGTSAAAPTMAGSYTQLYQAYRELNGGANPNAGFLKAVVLNTAYDKGNIGPDFKFGWGRIDAYQGFKVLQDESYTNDAIAQGGANTHDINIPSGVAEARMMIYWTDPAAAVNTSKALVNDLDIHVIDPESTRHDPWILDPTPDPALLDLPATRGVDNLNNVEQVSISAPAAGVHKVHVAGTAIPMGTQEYYIVWAFFYDEVRLTYPLGGEGFVPGETERIHWDAFGDTGTFTLEYSTDNGGSWTTIFSGINAATRLFNWTVPNDVSAQALVRVTRGGQSDVSDANFTIIGLPQNLSFSNQCKTGMTLSWNAVPGADEYVVYQLGQQYMESVATTASLSYDFNGLTTDQTHWLSVQAIINGASGRRADAVSFFADPGLANCRNTVSIEKTVSAAIASAGDTLEYTISFTSFYDTPITSISVTDVLDPTWLYIDNTLSCGSIDNGTITIDSSQIGPDGSITCSFKVRSDVLSSTLDLFEDDLESGSANWTIDNQTGAATWSLSTANANSPSNSWFVPNAGNENNTEYIVSTPITLLEGSELSFFHDYDTESGWDGGFVEISNNNGASWTDLGPMMTENGYNGGLGNGSNSQVANRAAFTGNSNGYIKTTVDLSSYSTKTVLIRFGFGEDDNTFSIGWFVDDVQIRSVFRQTNAVCVVYDQGAGSICATAETVMLPCTNNCDSCIDGVQNGDEADIDCGGSLCALCPCTQTPDTLTYDNTMIADNTFEKVKKVIEMKGAVTTSTMATVDLHAGTEVLINDEFTSGDSSLIIISIEDCEQN